MIRTLPLFLLLFCTACIQLGGDPLETSFYLLEPVAETSLANKSEQIKVELNPIEFPNYLNRPQIVSRTRNNSLVIAEYDRWAEPLLDNITRSLQENLIRQLAGIRISSAPWDSPVEPTYIIKLTINRFDGVIGEQTEIDIRWALIAAADKQELLREHYLVQTPIGNSYQDLVDGLNAALAGLSKDLATALLTLQR